MSKEFNGIQRPTVYRHANPDLAFVDSNNVAGGFRTKIITLQELYNGGIPRPLISEASIGKFKEYSTIIYVEETNKYYVLVNYDNSHNINGWEIFIDNVNTFITITGATNGLTKIGRIVGLGGNLTENTMISGVAGSHNLTINQMSSLLFNTNNGTSIIMDSNIIITAPNTGAKYDIDYSGGYVARSIPDVNFVTGLTSNGITGATNGLIKIGQNVELGGVLTKTTEINIVSGTSFTIKDNRMDGGGIKYHGDYSTFFSERSLVDKGYVDSISAGLVPINTVDVATTSGITLSGLQTIDGVALSVGNRVLVKNQIDGTKNGIYVVSVGIWNRAEDYNNTPNGEVQQGNIIPVLTGNTQGNQLWVLTTHNPIMIDVTPLVFARFSRPVDILDGNGINITQVGGQKTISVDLLNNGGLAFIGNELSVNENIAGNGLLWNSGIINLDNSAVGLTGATNGLTKIGQDVVLGGNFDNDIIISGSSEHAFLVEGGSIGFLGGEVILRGGVGTGTNTAIRLFNTGHMEIFDGKTIPVGIVYNQNYHSGYVNRSLVDKEYVDNQISGGTLSIGNGLTRENNIINLGGNLNRNTNINGNNAWDLSMNSLRNFQVSSSAMTLNSSSAMTFNSNQGININENGGWGIFINDNAGGGIFITTPNTISLSNNIVINPTPPQITGETFSVLVRNNVGVVKTIQGTELGDDNNNYFITTASTNITLTSDMYVVLVNTSVSGITLTLPISPIAGQSYKIKDATGDAITNIITINGNGRDIDNASTAVINTDYGAIEIAYNAAWNKWFVLSFVN